MTNDQKYMQMAINKCREGVDRGQTPFAACIVKGDKVIACDHNIVWASTDITAHGEIHAIRNACRHINNIDLSSCTIYSTCEPCPMCFTAIHWARISRIVYGADIADAERFGFNELKITNHLLKKFGLSNIQIVPDFMKKECVEVFEYWVSKNDCKVY